MSESVIELLRQIVSLVGTRANRIINRVLESGYSKIVLCLLPLSPYVSSLIRILTTDACKFANWIVQANKLLQAIRDILSWLFGSRKPKKTQVELARATTGMVVESVVQGSVENPMSHRPWEVLILNYNEEATGKGFRLFDYLIVPEHVVSTAKSFGDKVKIRGVSDNSIVYDITDKEGDCIYSDVLCIHLDIDIWSRLTTSRVKIGYVDGSESASVVGVKGFGTTGRVRPSYNIDFASVSYDGTTLKGYSGATYSSGNLAYGMHLNGNPNCGVAIDFLRALVKWQYMRNAESHDNDHSLKFARNEFLTKDGRRKAGVEVKPYGLDQVRIRSRGVYHIYEKDTLRELGDDSYNHLMYSEQESLPVFPQSPSYGASRKSAGISLPTEPISSAGISGSSVPLQDSQTAPSKSLSKSQMKRMRQEKRLLEFALKNPDQARLRVDQQHQ